MQGEARSPSQAPRPSMRAMSVPFLLKTSLLAAALACTSALAGTVQVTVLNADGKPAADTVVMVQPVAPWSPQAAPPPVVVAQKDIRFVPYVTVIPVGGSIRLVNKDNFDHHVRSQPGGPLGTVAPAREFEMRMPAATAHHESSNDVKFDVPGVVVLGCHIHGSMRGHVYVSVTPWAAVTDANGKVTLNNVPDGEAELRLWHPDQLVDQPMQKVQVAQAAHADAKLNFTPKARRVTRESSYY